MKITKVLIVDDDAGMGSALSNVVRSMGHAAIWRKTLKEGLAAAEIEAADIVFLDVRLPDGCGAAALGDFRALPARPEVIVITGYADVNDAEYALSHGAWDYIRKPAELSEMKLALTRAIEYRGQKCREPVVLKRDGIVGSSAALKAVLELVARAAATDAAVLVSGETGTGKELFARAIHDNSSRAAGNFVVVDCAALPETLVESTLFGHERGAFTSAERRREGLARLADGGTLFLDEVGELPLTIQKKFLRLIQEKHFLAVGGDRLIRSDFRLVSATSRDLKAMADEGGFRQDLLYRLCPVCVELPSLRQRDDDVRELALFYINRCCAALGTRSKGISPCFMEALRGYRWPGNVRELFGVLDKALAVARHDRVLYAYHLPVNIRLAGKLGDLRPECDCEPALPDDIGAWPRFREYQHASARGYIKRLLALVGGDKRAACRIAGISQSHLYNLLKETGADDGS